MTSYQAILGRVGGRTGSLPGLAFPVLGDLQIFSGGEMTPSVCEALKVISVAGERGDPRPE